MVLGADGIFHYNACRFFIIGLRPRSTGKPCMQKRLRRNEVKMKTSQDLQQLLHFIDHKSYPAYKDTKGSYQFSGYILSIDHVQGDPFAAPSRLSISLTGEQAYFPKVFYDTPWKRISLQDHLTRLFYKEVQKYNFKAKGSGKSGLISVSRCGQEILERSACTIHPTDGSLVLRFEVGFPANGRTINSEELEKILFDFLPLCIKNTLYYKNLNAKQVKDVALLSEDQHFIRESLSKMGLCAFVANGSVLPRESGVSSLPMKNAVAFTSPASLEVTLQLPNYGELKGMGIRKGITLIVGGGYHGKSTLLKALELGVYDHIAGDGREYVITDSSALKLRAEDGRCIKKTDISLFVNRLPNGKDTVSFQTEDASGSTSQAANAVEGMESGSSLFLIDEDTCATNFMIRDELMQRVVHRDQEPITPFIERARFLYEACGISSILVAGSSGSFFHIADCILQMDQYMPKDITTFAKEEAKAFPALSIPTDSPSLPGFCRCPLSLSDNQSHSQERGYRGRSRGRRPDASQSRSRVKIKAMGRDALSLDKETIDLRYVEQLIDSEQTTALGYMLAYADQNLFDGTKTIQDIVTLLEAQLEKNGLAFLCPGDYIPSNMAVPRSQEIFSCFNRYRKLKLN